MSKSPLHEVLSKTGELELHNFTRGTCPEQRGRVGAQNPVLSSGTSLSLLSKLMGYTHKLSEDEVYMSKLYRGIKNAAKK